MPLGRIYGQFHKKPRDFQQCCHQIRGIYCYNSSWWWFCYFHNKYNVNATCWWSTRTRHVLHWTDQHEHCDPASVQNNVWMMQFKMLRMENQSLSAKRLHNTTPTCKPSSFSWIHKGGIFVQFFNVNIFETKSISIQHLLTNINCNCSEKLLYNTIYIYLNFKISSMEKSVTSILFDTC